MCPDGRWPPSQVTGVSRILFSGLAAESVASATEDPGAFAIPGCTRLNQVFYTIQ